MIITNNYGLSSRTYNAIVASMNEYDAGESDYSITTLYNPPRIVHLTKRHWDEIVVDARDLIWAFWGNIGHLALARYAEGMSERRLFTTILDRRISGQTDHYHAGVITDYKFVKVKAMRYASQKKDWPFQLNAYAYLFRQHGFPVESLEIEAVLKDWEERLVKGRGYPPAPIQIIRYPIWKETRISRALHQRVKLMIDNEPVGDGDLPECTKVERWEQRWGARLRCEKYCHAKEFCNQYKAYKG